MFIVINLSNNEPIKDESGKPVLFDAGDYASQVATNLTQETGVKHQVRRHVESPDEWIAREKGRFERGEYERPFWLRETDGGWALQISAHHSREIVEFPENHFVHISRKDRAKIAFTQNEEKGRADIQTPLKVGTYLTEFAIFPNITDASMRALFIQQIALAHSNAYAPSILHFAENADDIEEIYMNGPNSCMSKSPRDYDGFCHPVRVYGEGDLSLAYLRNDNDGVSARALVWKAQKFHGRIYGDNERMKNALINAGFIYGEFEGAKIKKIYDDENSNYIMPYLDGIQSVSSANDTQWRISRNGDYYATNTNGLLHDHSASCERCGDTYHEDDLRAVYFRRMRSEAWCEHCRDNNAFWCDRAEEYVSDEHCAHVDGEAVADWIAEDEATWCEYSEEYTFDECVTVHVEYGLETWRKSDAEEYAFRAIDDGEWYSRKYYSCVNDECGNMLSAYLTNPSPLALSI